MRQRQTGSGFSGDAELLAACQAGNQQAWNELVERYSRLVFSIALRSGLSEHDAADVVQNVFVTVLRRLETLRDPERFSAWLITTTRRESWRYRKGQRQSIASEETEIVDPDPAVEDQVIAWEQALVTHQALERLGIQCRTLLTMIFLNANRPSYQEIAARLDIAVGSIGPIRARCLKRLKGHLVELGFEADR